MKKAILILVLVSFSAVSCVKTPKLFKPDSLVDGVPEETVDGDVGAELVQPDVVGSEIEDGVATDGSDVGDPSDAAPDVEDSLEETLLDDTWKEETQAADVEVMDTAQDNVEPLDVAEEEVALEDTAAEDVVPEDVVPEDVPPEVICQDECAAGTSRCSEAGVPEHCVTGDDECTVWQEQAACGDGFACQCGELEDGICPVDTDACLCISQCGPCGSGCDDFKTCDIVEGVGTCVWDCDVACVDRCDDAGTDGACQCAECDDGNPCTADSCDLETDLCQAATETLDGEECNADDDGCTVGDSCMDGACVPGALADCSDSGGNCLVGTCLSSAPHEYECQSEQASEGTACDDDDFCTIADKCQADGSCVGPVANNCGLEADPCQEVTCNPFTESCKLESMPDGDACDDEETCSVDDQCVDGVCVGTIDICAPRVISTVSSLAGTSEESGPVQVADVGQGRGLASWKSGSNVLSGRFVDAQLSLSYPELVLFDGWKAVDTDCSTQLAGHATAARADGAWLLATVQKVATVTLSTDYKCDIAWRLRFGATGYSAQGEVLAESQQIGNGHNVWTDFYKSSGGKLYVSDCNCADYPANFQAWMELNFPGVSAIAGGGVTTAAYGDGSFGMAYWQEYSDGAYYQPVTDSFELLDLVALGQARNVHMCVSPAKDLALLVYSDGDGDLAGRFVDHDDADTLSEPFAITTVAAGTLEKATCTGLDDGSFVVTVADCPVPYDCDTTLQLVSDEGTIADSDTLLHLDDTGEQLAFGGPVLFPDGRYVVVYHDDPFGGPFPAVKARTYSGELVPQSTARTLSASENVGNFMPVANLVGGELMASWWRSYLGVTKALFRRIDADGNPVFGVVEHMANSVTQGVQSGVDGVELPDAEFALVWHSEGMSGGVASDIALRRFGPTGTPLGPEIRVNSTIVGDQLDPGIAYDAGTDTLLVTWTHDTDDGSTDIRGRLLAGDGTTKSDEFLVNWKAQAPENEVRSTPLFLNDGSFVVTYTGWSSPGYLQDIFGQAFANNAEPLTDTGKLRMNYKRGDRQDHSDAVAIPGTKSFVVASAKYSESNWTPMEVSVRKLTLGIDGESGLATFFGLPNANDVLITDTGYPEDPTIATDGSKLMVCWKALNFIHCQPLTTDLDFAGAAFTMESVGYPMRPSLAARQPDHFVLAYDQYEAAGDGDEPAVVLHQLDALGSALEPAILANTTTQGAQNRPLVLPISLSELLVVSWTSNGQDGSGDGIVFRVLP